MHDVQALQQAIDQLRLALAVGALLLILLALAAARAVARSVLAPVEEAAEAAERIRTGDLSARVAVTSDDEFGNWAEAFNRMAATLESTIASLEAAQDQNRRFVADVAHELRTPLTALVAEASIVGAHLDDLPPESRRAAELLVTDVRRLRTLVEELMELSRFDAGAEQVEVVPVDVRRLVGAVVTARLPAARILPGEDITIESDPRRLERILGNLLDNAREHGGAADVRVTVARAGERGHRSRSRTAGPGSRPTAWTASSSASASSSRRAAPAAAAWAWPSRPSTPRCWAATCRRTHRPRAASG